MRERVRLPKEFDESVLDRLKADGVFETKQKAFIFAASVGFALHRDEATTTELPPFGNVINLSVFDKDEDYIDVLAAATRNDLAVMDPSRQPERVELFEIYAFLGLKEMKRACYDERPEDPLSGILALLDRLSRSGADPLPGLAGLL